MEVVGNWSDGRLRAPATDETLEGAMLRAGANPRGMQGHIVGC